METRIGLHLYSIRETMAYDFIGSLEKVKQAGYDCVEFAGYKMLQNNLDEVVAFSLELGLFWCG